MAVSVKFQSNSTDISSPFVLLAGGVAILGFNDVGWVETAVGEALNINLSLGISVNLTFNYCLI